MIIRKEFRVESAHIVRNCTSERCSHSVHGHSAVIEVLLESRHLDNAQMVYDFGLLKGTVKQLIDSMDHCYLLCNNDKPEFCDFIKNECDRYIELPFNPSAEMLSMFVFDRVKFILEHTIPNNGEQDIKVVGVKYHETTTGYALCDEEDWKTLYNPKNYHVHFSEGVTKDWSEDLRNMFSHNTTVKNPSIKQQIKLD